MAIQNFRKFFKVASKEAIRWFPGHMGKGMKQMQQKLKQVDCVIGEKTFEFLVSFILTERIIYCRGSRRKNSPFWPKPRVSPRADKW